MSSFNGSPASNPNVFPRALVGDFQHRWCPETPEESMLTDWEHELVRSGEPMTDFAVLLNKVVAQFSLASITYQYLLKEPGQVLTWALKATEGSQYGNPVGTAELTKDQPDAPISDLSWGLYRRLRRERQTLTVPPKPRSGNHPHLGLTTELPNAAHLKHVSDPFLRTYVEYHGANDIDI